MFRLTTPRTYVRHATLADARFIVELLNDPGWIRYIGDRNIDGIDAAKRYIEERLIGAYRQLGYGLYLVERRKDGEMIGMCGLVKRDGLDGPDIGFAFLERFTGQGYGVETSRAIINHARDDLGLSRLYGITLPDNRPSIRLLEKLGLVYDRIEDISGDGEACKIFVADL
jgi:RimJ/RimL family protein N-acetyltransferase